MRVGRRDDGNSGSGTDLREAVQRHNLRSGHRRGGEASSPDMTRQERSGCLPCRRKAFTTEGAERNGVERSGGSGERLEKARPTGLRLAISFRTFGPHQRYCHYSTP